MAMDGDFQPNVINSCVFLIGLILQCNVFGANYRGDPFVTPLREHTALFRTLAFNYVLAFLLALELVPGLGEIFELVAFPDAGLKFRLVGAMVVDTG